MIGALNVFTDEQVRLGESDLAGPGMADVATIGLLHRRDHHERTMLSQQLQTALHSRIQVEQAKGALAALAGVGVNEAFSRMRAHARRNNITLTDVAAAVVNGTLTSDALTPA